VNKKLVSASLGVALLGTIVLPNFANAGNDNHGYYFEIRPLSADNSNGDAYYRQTTNSRNTWKVNFKGSTEGAGTVTNYWIRSSKGVASSKVAAKQGNVYYTIANSNAAQSNITLVGENNNYTANGYAVSGTWDEETGIIK